MFYTYKALIALRKKLPVLTEGNYQDLAPEHPALWCYQRQTTNEKLLVLANLSELEQVVELPQVWCNQHTICLMNNYDEHVMFENKMILKPYQAVYLYK